jgi:diguanylate cyclase
MVQGLAKERLTCSAVHDLKRAVKGIQLGAEDYLPKPFEPTLLKSRKEALPRSAVKLLHNRLTITLLGRLR